MNLFTGEITNMKQLRTIKKKASSLIHTGADVETETKGNEELAKDVLLELSDALQEGPEVDPLWCDQPQIMSKPPQSSRGPLLMPIPLLSRIQ